MIFYLTENILFNTKKGRVAAGIYLINEKGQILLQKRGSQTNSPNVWGCFGGKADPGESIKKTALREFKEETGYEGHLSNIKLIHINNNPDGFIFYSYLAYLPNNIETPMVGQITIDGDIESDDAQYFNLKDVYTLDLHPGTRFTFQTKMPKIKKYINDCKKNI